ncbi:MAG: cytochrome c biogenesis protein ResB, partial [Candidatus Magnetoovum sp. WYHC-5]|nr:cytochrome c biogenesis protein ResB [Candidatus Magnetoovum sp. WYHC-5]
MKKEKLDTGIEKKNIIDRVWKFLASVKLGIILISLIAFTSIIGTIIEQNVQPEKTMKFFVKLFGPELAPKAYVVAQKLDFTDMYNSTWFLSILFIFSVNLIVCSLERLPAIYRAVNEPLKPLNIEAFNKYSIKKHFKLKGNMENAKKTIYPIIKRLGFKTEGERSIGIYQYYAQKGMKTRYAVYVIHLSIIVIFAGAVIGNLFGFNGYLNLPEGSKSSLAYTRDGKQHPLGFTIKCDDFNVDFYGNSDMPSNYTSWLTVIDNG